MNKVKTQTELIKELAEETKLSAAETKKVLEALALAASRELKEAGVFVLPGIGKLKVKDIPARNGRTPATGAVISIEAKRRISIGFNKAFKESV